MRKVMAILMLPALLFAFQITPNNGEWHGMQGQMGAYSIFYSPQNLASKYNPSFTLYLPFIQAGFTNNFLSLSLWNEFAPKDTFYDEDKAKLMDALGKKGFELATGVGLMPLGLSFGNFGLGVRGVAGAYGLVARDIFELGLYGNELGRTYNFGDADGEGIAYVETSVGAGFNIPVGERKIDAGLAFGYIYGGFYGEVTKHTGKFVSDSSYLEVIDTVEYRYALGGSGFTMRLGASTEINKKLTVGLSLDNLISSINWTKETKHGVAYVNVDKFNLFDLKDTTFADTFVRDSSYDYEGSFKTSLPIILRVGARYDFENAPLTLYADYTQGFKKTAISTTTPQVSIGGEYSPVSFLPLRLGFTLGGYQGFSFSAGFGISLPFYFLDIGYSASRGLFYGAKGHTITLAMGFRTPVYGEIKGSIKDSLTLEPLIATLEVETPKKSFTMKTDSLGLFKFKVHPGKTHIKILKKDYETREIFVDVDLKEKVRLDIKLRPLTAPFVATFVNSVTQEPVSGINVNIENELGGVEIFTTGPDGKVSTNLKEGAYTIKVEAEDYLPFQDVITVKAGETVAKKSELIPREGELLGKVFNAKTMKPLVADMVFYDTLGNEITKITSNKDGTYSVKLDQGVYRVKVTVPKYIPQEAIVVVEGGKKNVRDFGMLKEKMVFTFRNIYFDFNKATIKPESYPVLDSVAQILKENPTMVVEIGGHTDTRGSRRYNQRLSQRRAEAVKNYLVRVHGIDPSRLIAKGYGESRPLVKPERTEADYAKNRRVEFLIIGQRGVEK